jgi:hypothetical protein
MHFFIDQVNKIMSLFPKQFSENFILNFLNEYEQEISRTNEVSIKLDDVLFTFLKQSIMLGYNDVSKKILKFILDVSFDNNFLFKKAMEMKNYRIAQLILYHSSFKPTVEIIRISLEHDIYHFVGKIFEMENLPESIAVYKDRYLENKYNEKEILKIMDEIEQKSNNANSDNKVSNEISLELINDLTDKLQKLKMLLEKK